MATKEWETSCLIAKLPVDVIETAAELKRLLVFPNSTNF